MLTESQQSALYRAIGRLCIENNVLRGWAAWRADCASRQEKAARAERIRMNFVAVRCIRRKLRREER